MPATAAQTNRWLSQTEAADYYGVTDRTIRRYVAQGRICAYRVEGSRLPRYDRYELDSALRPAPTEAGGHHG